MKPTGSKTGALATHKSQHVFSLEGLQKSLFPAFSKNLTKCLRKCVRNCAQIYKMPLWMHCRKRQQRKCKKQRNCTKNYHQRVSHERGFRILKCIWAGLWARWAPRPSPILPTQPQDPPKPRFLIICVPSGVICHRFVVHISENCSPLLVLVSVLSGMNFQRNL